jgi:RNA polymerase sigma factor (sigma-70 family)
MARFPGIGPHDNAWWRQWATTASQLSTTDPTWVEAHARLYTLSEKVIPAARLGQGDREDLVQQAWVILQNPRCLLFLKNEANLPARYLGTTLWRIYTKRLKTEARSKHLDPPLPSIFGDGVSDETPEAVAKKNEAEERLRAALSRLSPEDQELLRLRYWEGVRGQRLATMYQTTRGAITQRVLRLVARLKKMLE